jgi:hypothetical protein
LQRWPDPLTVVARRAKACTSIDARRWHREGLLRAGQYFSWSWTRGGEPAGSIGVRPEWDAVVLIYRSQSWDGSEWKSVERRVPITWTACHLGGRRPWFICPVSPAVDIVGVELRFYSVLENCSRVGTAAAWPMKASKNPWASAVLEGRRRSGCNWEGARACSNHFRTGRKGCTGGRVTVFAVLTTLLTRVS